MESLALLVAVIVAISVIGGPISLIFSLLTKLTGFMEVTRIIFVFFFGIPAMLVSIYLISRWTSTGATIMGLFGLGSSGFGIYRTVKQVKTRYKD